jgi:6-pyruvoyltetrahydropterin/6-carboxytetrahydropterin synthase
VIRLGRRYRFSASHRLDSPALGPEENAALYGKCNNPNGHGHDYKLEVVVEGDMDGATGRAVDRTALDRLVGSAVLARLSHADLNSVAGGMADPVPTTERLAAGILRALRERWADVFPAPGPRLAAVRLHETRRNMVEARTGEEGEAIEWQS